jgi:hypothetical protein
MNFRKRSDEDDLKSSSAASERERGSSGFQLRESFAD